MLPVRVMGLIVVILLASCQQYPEVPLDPSIPSRSVTHVMGTTEVPVEPQRVIVLDITPLDAAIALGIEPIGTISYSKSPDYLGDKARDIEVVGKFNQPNLEKILRLKPDLILGLKSLAENLYPKLSRIAPTVFIEGAGYNWDWKNNFRIYADALNQSEKAEQLLEDYQQELEALQKLLKPSPDSLTASIIIKGPLGLIAHTPRSFSGSILKEIGFKRNAAQGNEEQFFLRVAREDLSTPDGDVLFLIHYPNTISKEEFVRDRLWSQLNAVQQNAVCEVSGEVWGVGRGILGAREVLKDVKICIEQIQTPE
ncbi:MAG: iron-siderophore ABC transporter substrate-binding protein [Cyanobacteria bacterium P01_F01_bin.116]